MKTSKLKTIITHNWSVKALCLAIAIFIFVFHRLSLLEDKKITVPLKINGLSELIISNDIPRNLSITLRGDKEGINPIAETDILAFLELSNYSTPGKYEVPVHVSKQGTALQVDPLEIVISPPVILLELSRKTNKIVTVSPNITGSLPRGYEITKQSVNPETIEIEGPEDLLKNISKINTEIIDLSNRNVTFTKNVRLITMSPRITITGKSNADFTANINAVQFEKDFADISINAINLSEKFKIELTKETANIRLQGLYTSIELFGEGNKNDILYVDCSPINGEGDYTLPVTAELTNDITVVSIDPDHIDVKATVKVEKKK
ncbi:hypothetical protein FACS1894102_0180 [Spirochaetia bacterium]|nr:hypothetical protein FACS1894102_0180 [Spirochaetia bacterium]